MVQVSGISRQRRSSAFGFTLVELLVVIGIIALLISILLPALNRAREEAKKTVCLTGLRSFGQLLNMYANDNKGRVPLGYSGNKHAGYMIYNGGWRVLANLYEANFLKEPSAYYCPSKLDVRWQFNTSENPWPPGPSTGKLSRLGMTVRPQVRFDAMNPSAPYSGDHPNFRGKFPQLSNLRNKAIAAEMFGDPSNAASIEVDPSVVNHKKIINVYYADNSAGAVDVTGVDSVDNESIATILKKLRDLHGVPTSGTSPSENQVYLGETTNPPTGIWAKFDKAK
jgi:prepilin-type N-terminal cleavage/methylation domain-containing protein